MRLNFKMVYLFLWYFLKLKIVKTGVLWVWGFHFCLRFRRQFFGHAELGDWSVFNFFFFLILVLKGVMKKFVGCFFVYLFFIFLGGGGGGLLKRCDVCVCDSNKNHIVTFFLCFLIVERETR